MTWKTKLRDELVSRIQPTGLTVYMVYDSNAGGAVGKTGNPQKIAFQDELITALTAAGLTVTKATWDLDTYDNRGILVMFFSQRIIQSQKFKDMIAKATAIKWILTVWELPLEPIENFELFEEKTIREPDGQIPVQVWKRIKVFV